MNERLLISTDGLEELLSPLAFGLAAALEGMDVHRYFQGPAVRALAEGFRPRLRGWARPFSRFAAAGMATTGHIPAQQKLIQLRSLGAQLYMCGPSSAERALPPMLRSADAGISRYRPGLTDV